MQLKAGAVGDRPVAGYVEPITYQCMIENHQKSRVYQVDFDKESLQVPLDPNVPLSDECRFHHCVPMYGKDRQEAIRDLVTLLPEGMIALHEDDSLELTVDNSEVRGFWLDKIRVAFSELDSGNIVFSSGPAMKLVRQVNNPLDTEYRFCVQTMPVYWAAYPSSDFLRALSCLEKGQRLYVGSVLECR